MAAESDATKAAAAVPQRSALGHQMVEVHLPQDVVEDGHLIGFVSEFVA